MTKYWQWLTNLVGKHPHVVMMYGVVLLFMFWVYIQVVLIVIRDYVRCIRFKGIGKPVTLVVVKEREESSWSREVISVNSY